MPPDDAYDILVKKSEIKENYVNKSHSELNDTYMIPCDQINMFYNDSLFYLHFHYSLYKELYKYNLDNNFNITTFTDLWKKLIIEIDTTETDEDGLTVATSDGTKTFTPKYKLNSITVSDGGSGYAGSETLQLTPYDTSVITVASSKTFHRGLKQFIRFDKAKGRSGFLLGDIITFNTPASGTAAVGKVTKIDSTGRILEIKITERGAGYTSAPTVSSYTLNGATIQNSVSDIDITFTSSDITIYVKTINITDPSTIYTSNGKIRIPVSAGDEAVISPITNIGNIGYIDPATKTFTFKTKIFKTFYNSILQYCNSHYQQIDNNKELRIENITALPATSIDTQLIQSISVGGTETYTYTKASLDGDHSLSGDTYFSSGSNAHTNRKKKFSKTLQAILNQDVTQILGYLTYQIRYYNLIVLNTSIQRMIYIKYLRDNSLQMSTANIFKTIGDAKGAGVDNLNAIKTHIDNMKNNLKKMNEDITKINNFFSDSTKQYPEKISLLNQNKENYNKIQNSLNIVIKDYNQHYDNYNRLKNYASIIIIFIVILIIASIAVTVLPYFNANAKNTYYILMLILIIILTILFYNNFSHINLYERFTTISCDSANWNKYKINYTDGNLNNANKGNNETVFNGIISELNEYNKESNLLNEKMSSGIYITDSEAITQDADNYINDIYLTKMKKINIYKTKHTELKNLIETMKQQIIYLYNIIIILCIFIIILLIALILYVNMPYATNYIIAFVSISIFILVIYYVYAIVKPTRLVANKNYWADHNPSKTTIGKL